MTTNAYAAKRALFDRLTELAALGGGALAGVQVAYAYPGATAKAECVYGGGVTFDQPGEDDMVDGKQVLVKEDAQVSVHIRIVQSPPSADGIRDTDERAEAIGDAIGEALAANPHLAGGHSVTRILGGQGDYAPTDTQAVSILSYRISVESYL